MEEVNDLSPAEKIIALINEHAELGIGEHILKEQLQQLSEDDGKLTPHCTDFLNPTF